MCVPEIKPRASARAKSTLNHLTISPVPYYVSLHHSCDTYRKSFCPIFPPVLEKFICVDKTYKQFLKEYFLENKIFEKN